MADWKKQDFTIPDWATSAQQTVAAGTQVVSGVLSTALAIAHTAQAYGTSITNPTSIALQAIIAELEGLRQDLQQVGFYASGDWDQSKLANLYGGYSQYQQRMYGRLRDRQDPEYPNLSPSTEVLAVFTYLSVGGVADIPQLQKFLDASQRFFGLEPVQPVETLPAPSDVRVTYGTPGLPYAFWTEHCKASDTQVRVSWTLPEGSVGLEPSQFLVQINNFADGLPIGCSILDPATQEEVKQSVLTIDRTPLVLFGSSVDVSTEEPLTLWTDPQGYPVELAEGFWGSTYLVSAERRPYSLDTRWGQTIDLFELPRQPTLDRGVSPAHCGAGEMLPPLYVRVSTLGDGDRPRWDVWLQDGQPVAVQAGAAMSPPSSTVEINPPIKASPGAEQTVLDGLASAIAIGILAEWWRSSSPHYQVWAALDPWVVSSLGMPVEDWLASSQTLSTFRSRLWDSSYQVAVRLWSRSGSHQGDVGSLLAGLVPYAKTVQDWKVNGLTVRQHCESANPLEGIAAGVYHVDKYFDTGVVLQFGVPLIKSPIVYTGWTGMGFIDGSLQSFQAPAAIETAAKALIAGRAVKMPDRLGWQSVTAAPMLGWADRLLELGLTFARQGVTANAGTDALLDRQVHLLEAKIAELSLLIAQLDSLMAFPVRFGFGTSVQILVVDAKGVEGVIDALAQAGNPPSDGAGFYTAGSVIILAGLPSASVDLVRGLL